MTNESLSSIARELIDDGQNDIFVSAASAWKITTKYKKGQLETAISLLPDFADAIERNGFINLPITSTHMVRSALLQGDHRDSFDRIPSARGILEDIALITIDKKIADFGVLTRW